MSKEKLLQKLINCELNYNKSINCDTKSYYYNMAYILVRQTQFLSDKDKQFVISAIEDLDLYKKVLSFAFARNEKQINDTKRLYLQNKLTELKNLVSELECLIKN